MLSGAKLTWRWGGYWIVMGWFDHNWVGIEEEETDPAGTR